MEKVIRSSQIAADTSAIGVVDYLDSQVSMLGLDNAIMYYDFPIFQDYEDELLQPQLMIISEKHGIIIINSINPNVSGELIQAEVDKMNHFYSLIYSRLIQSKILRSKRDLVVNISMCLYGEKIGVIDDDNIVVANSLEDIGNLILESISETISETQFLETRSIVEGAKALTKSTIKRPTPTKAGNKLDILVKLEAEIANFDAGQRKASIALLDGPQRIRGLAGSGKTIVLAMKVAQIHLINPEKKILFTFYTKSLYQFIKDTITKFYRHFKGKDPDWSSIDILHGWGGGRLEGVYYNACSDNGIRFINLSEAKAKSEDAFDYACENLLTQADVSPKYDYVIIDEAQDFPLNFFKLICKLTRGDRDRKAIVWAYDELQNIFNVKKKTTVDFFGLDIDKQPLIDLERSATTLGLPRYLSNDVVLHKCYRNPRAILLCAHALGFGIYSEPVQMLEDREHWEDVGYEVLKGNFAVGSYTEILRPEANSPLSISKYESFDEIVKFISSENLSNEISWITNEVKIFLEQGLSPQDILIISLDDRFSKTYFQRLTNALGELSIEVNNILSNPYTSTKFSIPGMVTLSTVYRAKGNEAPVVFCIGLDALNATKRSRITRNRLFTAFTRAKAWLRISGVGSGAKDLIEEIRLSLDNYPSLKFTYPEPKNIEMVQRDLNNRERKIKEIQQEYHGRLKELGLSDKEIQDELHSGLKDEDF